MLRAARLSAFPLEVIAIRAPREQGMASGLLNARGVARSGSLLGYFLGWLMTCALAHATTAPVVPAKPMVTAKAALIIGNAQYDVAGSLKNPLNDAQDMCHALGTLGFKTSCHINVRSRVQLRALIQDFFESLPDNAVVLVYYAGHAVQANGENYLIPTGAQLQTESAVVSESVNVSYLMRELHRRQDFLNIVILDACRNNPLTAGTASLPQGLAQVTDLPNGTVVLYATAADETALDGEGRNGILTKNLLAQINDLGNVDDLFKKVSLGVQKDSQALGRIQKPSLYTNFTGQYCFVRCTDLELLQKERQEKEQKIAELEKRVSAGDDGARVELTAAVASNARLEEQIRKKDEETHAAAKATKEREKKAFVPPAF